MLELSGISPWVALIIFIAAAAVIAFAGTRLARLADLLADRTGLGEVIVGALFVGASTSMPGAITSIVTAAEGHPSLAIGNALGGITVQTAFLAVADLTYRRANLEHAAATVTGLAQGVLLIAILTIPLIAAAVPQASIFGLHPASVVTVAIYIAGLSLLNVIRDTPMWSPVQTAETRPEISPPDRRFADISTSALWGRFAALAAAAGAAGYCIGQTSIVLVTATGVSETAFGAVFSATSTSLPELVIAIAAARIGAANLAVSNILGGNAFDVLFLSAIDVAYDGDLYAQFAAADRIVVVTAILMTSVVLLGLLRRERRGPAGIGFESVIVLGLYAAQVLFVFS